MATNITFRKTDSALNKPSATTVKNAPLSSLEIDGNFKSIKDNLDEMIEGGVGKLVQRHDVVSLGGQTIFDLPFSYTPGMDALMVFVNGVLGVAGSRYTETSSTRITMTPALALGDKVTVMANVSPINNLPYNPVDGRKDLFVAGTHYTKNTTTSVTLSSAPAKSGTVKVFFDGIYQNKDTYYIIGNIVYFGEVGDLVAIPSNTVEIQYEIPSQFVGLDENDAIILADAQTNAYTSATIASTQAGLAVAAKDAAVLARDVALVQAGVYPDVATGRAAVSDGQYYKVQGSGDVAAFEYRRTNSTTSVLVATYPSLDSFGTNGQTLRHFPSTAVLLTDSGTTSLNGGTKNVQALVDTDLNALGYSFGNVLTTSSAGVRKESYHVIPFPAGSKDKSWIAASIFVKCADWASVDANRVRLMVFGPQTNFTLTNYTELRADLRRYWGVFQVNNAAVTSITSAWIEVTTSLGNTADVVTTGALVAASTNRPSGVQWGDATVWQKQFDKLNTINELRLIKSEVINGNLSGGTQEALTGGHPASVAVTDPLLVNRGMAFAVPATNLTIQQETYFRLTVKDSDRLKRFVAVSLYVQTADWASVNANRVRLLFLPAAGGGSTSNAVVSTFEAVSSTIRRYNAVLPVGAATTLLGNVWFEVTCPAARPAAVYMTGCAMAPCDTAGYAVDHLDFDPFGTRVAGNRITTLELLPARVTTAESNISALQSAVGSPQTEHGLVVPSSWHLVEDRPLTVYRAGLSQFGRASKWEIAFVGKKNGLPFVKYVDEQIDLDARRLSGAGFVYARSNVTTTPVFRRPTTFYSSSATKTGSPKIMVIGDSLTEEGTITALKNKLTAAGVTPQFVGTYNDFGGTPGEGRSSWEFSDFTRKHIFIDAANPVTGGVTRLYPIDASGQGDGVVTTPEQYMALGNASKWKYNPFIRPTVEGDASELVKNGYVFDFAFYLSRFSLATPDIVMIALGTNDFNSNADAVSAVNVAEGLQIMVGQIRAAAPNAAIGIIFKDMHTEALVAVRAAMATYGGREAEKLFVLPVFSVLDPYLSYCADQEFVVNSTDAIGVQNITQQDLTHMDSNGREQWAEMTFAFCMNRV